MGSDEFDVTNLQWEMDGNDESVLVSGDVENNSTPTQHTR
jgi:hypothetical protein